MIDDNITDVSWATRPTYWCINMICIQQTISSVRVMFWERYDHLLACHISIASHCLLWLFRVSNELYKHKEILLQKKIMGEVTRILQSNIFTTELNSLIYCLFRNISQDIRFTANLQTGYRTGNTFEICKQILH